MTHVNKKYMYILAYVLLIIVLLLATFTIGAIVGGMYNIHYGHRINCSDVCRSIEKSLSKS